MAGNQIIQFESLVDIFHSIPTDCAFINNYGNSLKNMAIINSLGARFMQLAVVHSEMRLGFGGDAVIVTPKELAGIIMRAIQRRREQLKK